MGDGIKLILIFFTFFLIKLIIEIKNFRVRNVFSRYLGYFFGFIVDIIVYVCIRVYV